MSSRYGPCAKADFIVVVKDMPMVCAGNRWNVSIDEKRSDCGLLSNPVLSIVDSQIWIGYSI